MVRQRLEQFPKTQMVSFNQDPRKPCNLCIAFQEATSATMFLESLITWNQKLDADLVTAFFFFYDNRSPATHLAAAAALLSLASMGAQWGPTWLAWRRAPASRTVFSLLRHATIRTVPCIALLYVLSGPCFKSCQDIIKFCRRSQATLQVDLSASFTIRSYG